tara:strand:- start:1715 stop:2176 length:462 start_codon:yes stop_codon:yes gene_type:complete
MAKKSKSSPGLKNMDKTLKLVKKFVDDNLSFIIIIILLIIAVAQLSAKPKYVDHKAHVDDPGHHPKPVNHDLNKHADVGSGGKPILYYTPSCGFSKKQLASLEEANMIDKFELVNCHESPEKCKGVQGVPAFKFSDGTRASGLHSIDALKKHL